MPGPGDLYALCSEYLAACETALATTDAGRIERSYVSPGPPAWDCEQLTVHAGGPLMADTAPLQPPLQPGHRFDDGVAVNLVAMTATVLRCVPGVTEGGDLPSATALELTAQKTLADCWAIWQFVKNAYRQGEIFTRPDGARRELFYDPAVPLLTQGGLGGWQLQIRVQLDGYTVTI